MPSSSQSQRPPPLAYPDMIKQVKDKYDLRLRLVAAVQQIGVKPTARLYGTSPQTVRKWVRRYRAQKRRGLTDRSHAPQRCPHRTPAALEAQVRAARRRSGFGAARLKVEFELPVSVGAIGRILRQAGLVRPRKRKHRTKQDLRAVKAAWGVFAKLCHDTKDLDDIPHYWLQAQTLGLPIIQYTAREVVSGLTFVDYAHERSASLACVFGQRVMAHLAACGVNLAQVGFQTDNGSEYAGGKDHRGAPHGFKPTVEARGVTHNFIPPSAHTYQSDVETVHRLCEDEFFDREDFASLPHFIAMAASYWLYFNVARRNGSKGYRAPLQILQELAPQVNPRITLWQPVLLEHHLHLLLPKEIQHLRGKDLPVHPLTNVIRAARAADCRGRFPVV